MGKKQKEETPNINATPNRDIIQRLNFLYQASVYLQSLEPSASIPICNPPSSSRKSRSKSRGKAKEIQITESSKHTSGKKKHKRKLTTSDLARNYVQCMRIVGQKTTVKMYEEVLYYFPYVIRVSANWPLFLFSKSDPALKRSLCSSCNTTLIPGSTASVRVKSTYFTNSYAWIVYLILPKNFLKIKLESSSHGHLVVYTCLHCKSSKGIPAPPTLNFALATGTGTGTEELEGSTVTAVLGSLESSGSLTMAPPSQSQVQKDEKKKLTFSPRPHPRPLPLFARPDAGHVVFRGNEVLDK